MRVRRSNLGQAASNCGTNPCSIWDEIVANTVGTPSAPCLAYLQCADPVTYNCIQSGIFGCIAGGAGAAVTQATSSFAGQLNPLSLGVVAVIGLAVVAILVHEV